MIHRKFWRPVTALLSSLALLLMATQGFASAAGGNGLRVSPVRSDLTISPGQSQTISVNVTNITDQPATFQAVVNDFTANPNESGNPAILLNGQSNGSHSLKSFVSPIPNLTLGGGQEEAVPVTITVPAGTPGGGYYGVVRFAPASGSGESGKNVTLAGSVGSLILLKVPGNIVNKMSIASFDTRVKDSPSTFFTSNKNIDAVVRFQNEGNIQEAPFGKVLLKNRSGKIISEVNVNNTNPAGNVLPDSIRKFSVPLSHVGSFGIFHLEGNFGYGSNGQLLSASTTFYVVPMAAIIIFIIIVLVLLFLIFVLPRLIRNYNKRIIARASRRR